jgi:transglutaminase-like putative cysteine protease
MEIAPEPEGTTDGLDAAGNGMTLAWFSGLHQRLDVRVRFEVDTLRENPYDFILPRPWGAHLPGSYPPGEQALLTPYLRRLVPSAAVDAFAHQFARQQNGQTLPFLNALCNGIFRDFVYEVRTEGEAYKPEFTLQARVGSCRDLAVLFVDACRALGLAARFVSGFAQTDEDEHLHDLHAWAEVYLPGAGWRGYDPSHGLMAADCHVPVCSAPEAAGAAPLQGTFRGTGAVASFSAEVRIQRPVRVPQG